MLRSRLGASRRAATVAIGTAILAIGLLVLPAMASAKTASPSVEIGPFKTKGYTLNLFVAACASKTAEVTLDYSRGSLKNSVEYSYTGKGACSAPGDLKGANLTVSWPGLATIKLHGGSAGKLVPTKKVQGCTGGAGGGRVDTLRGSIDLSVSKAFGSLKAKTIKATVAKIANLKCRTPATPKITSFFGEFGEKQFISASLPKRGVHGIFISDDFTPAAGVDGSMFIDVAGTSKQFSLKAGAATLTNVKPFASGKLTMTELAACPDAKGGAQNVTLAGAITVNSPVIGKVSFGTANVTTAYIGAGAAYPGQCNGYGSTPLTAGVDNVCSNASAPCSISGGENDVFFDDTSMDGTQTVVSETIDYGDGSPAVAVTNGAIPDHVYTTAGNFTATVTIQSSDGLTETATTPVYITG